jgi:hypothetical protein
VPHLVQKLSPSKLFAWTGKKKQESKWMLIEQAVQEYWILQMRRKIIVYTDLVPTWIKSFPAQNWVVVSFKLPLADKTVTRTP